jgi:hypothetical protein
VKVESYKIKGWKERETGLLISENEDWILTKYIPVDYVVDGFKLYNKTFVKGRKSKRGEAQIAKVLELKEIQPNKPESFSFKSTIELLEWSEEKYGLFEFQNKDESDVYYGILSDYKNDSVYIDTISMDGEVEETDYTKFKLNQIRSITFETDYFNSIRLLMNDKLRDAENQE